jgi:hypothetical protein
VHHVFSSSCVATVDIRLTHLIDPVVFSCTGSMVIPFSTTLVISKTAKDIAQDIKTEASARCIPKQS